MSEVTGTVDEGVLYPQVSPPPTPTEESALNIPSDVLEHLLLKHLATESKQDIVQLSKKLGIISAITEGIVMRLRKKALIEVHQPENNGLAQGIKSHVLYSLTSAGRELASTAAKRDGYLGPVPIHIDDYGPIVRAQDVRHQTITREVIERALENTAGAQSLIPTLGPALNSGRALLFYGHAGTGKSFIASKLLQCFPNTVYIPYSIYAEGSVIELFSNQHHRPYKQASAQQQVRLQYQHDRRWVLCHRPNIQVGGELTMHMLEVNWCSKTRTLKAPLQLQANNGILVIDDLGRQSMSMDALLNRWIVPMEYRVDHLALPNGQQITLPFLVSLAFSTNLSPQEIADPAFLRRLGYKLHFEPLNEVDYRQLWQQMSWHHELIYSDDLFNVIRRLHRQHQVNYLPCLPKDLVGICRDLIRFEQLSKNLTAELIQQAWQLYFSDQPVRSAP
ncbi:hypothetical protein VST7929_01806 [Vibrio stylophorae]|uniref:AAA family ATPase n=1 Tax=Vibrio stylophorae TaxID=659351 RepID=A0ABM8ZUE5_9VIBR|nr:AAA family ATPase [Vibrio stylophorae]CAH0533929.1 hypothetical protein VST7929_01806 [Vibrio stylophorae]